MLLEVSKLREHEAYKLLIGSVVPRPIAWVSTSDALGNRNIGAFSFFTAVSDNPPIIMFSVGNDRRLGIKKDTLSNIEQTREFVVNIANFELAERMNVTATEYPPDVDEFEAAGLTPAACASIAAPRILEAPISMECQLTELIEMGAGPHRLVFGAVKCFHVRDDLFLTETGRIDMHGLDPIARMAGHCYSRSGIFEMKRREADYHG